MLNYYIKKAQEQKVNMITVRAFEYLIHDYNSMRKLKMLTPKNSLNSRKLKKWFYDHNPFYLLDISNVSSFLFDEFIISDLDFDALAQLINEFLEDEKRRLELAKTEKP